LYYYSFIQQEKSKTELFEFNFNYTDRKFEQNGNYFSYENILSLIDILHKCHFNMTELHAKNTLDIKIKNEKTRYPIFYVIRNIFSLILFIAFKSNPPKKSEYFDILNYLIKQYMKIIIDINLKIKIKALYICKLI
jgi:hypothetical protein